MRSFGLDPAEAAEIARRPMPDAPLLRTYDFVAEPTDLAREVESDLRAMGVAAPRALAPLLLAAVREVAILEHERGAPLPAVRRSFESLLDSGRRSARTRELVPATRDALETEPGSTGTTR